MPPNASFTNNKPFKPPRPTTSTSKFKAATNTVPSSPPATTPGQPAPQEAADSQSHGTIPPALLSRILHDNFKHSDTRITKDAMAVVEKYIEIFTKEAVVRCVHTKREQGDGTQDGFLEVDDLEKVVPQLLLDF